MSAFAKISFIVVVVALVPGQRSNAVLMHFTVDGPKDCPDGLTIKSTAGKEMIDFDVYVDAEEIAHAGELYKGRVKANAHLNIATPEQQIASVVVHGTTKGKQTRYQFQIAPNAAKTSNLQLGVSLFEKHGMPTIGGGVSMQVRLVGFEPKVKKSGEARLKQ